MPPLFLSLSSLSRSPLTPSPTARYLDVFFTFISVYNTLMKVLFVSASCTTVFFIFQKFKPTYDGNHDTFRVEFAVVPSMVLALIFNYEFTPLEVRIPRSRLSPPPGVPSSATCAASTPPSVLPRDAGGDGRTEVASTSTVTTMSVASLRAQLLCIAATMATPSP